MSRRETGRYTDLLAKGGQLDASVEAEISRYVISSAPREKTRKEQEKS
jgi:hypothetical protein